MNKNIPCEVIQDILPLYHDGICSSASGELVKDHIKDCKDCNNMLKALGDDSISGKLESEAKDVLKRHKRHELSKSMLIGIIIAAFLLLPIIISFLDSPSAIYDNVMLSAAMVLVAGFTAVPLIVKKNKFSIAAITALSGLVLLALFDIMLNDSFTGNKLYSALGAIGGIVFSLSLFIAPFVVRQLAPAKCKSKGLITMAWDTFWFVMLVVFNMIADGETDIKEPIIGMGLVILFAWLIFFIIRYTRFNAFNKAAIITALTGIVTFFGEKTHFVMLNVDGKNPTITILIVSLVIAAVLAGIGFIWKTCKKK